MRPLLAACLVAAVLAVPAASAHARFALDDGKVNLVIGNLNEPVTTYTKTGLDLIVSDGQKQPILDVQNTLQGELIAPDNVTKLSGMLQGQFGKPGSYTFSRPYLLTEPGQYRVHLWGTINGTAVDGTYNVAGAVEDVATTTFPSHPPTLADLQAAHSQDAQRITSLEARVAQLEAPSSTTGRTVPAGAAAYLILVVLVAAALARRPRT